MWGTGSAALLPLCAAQSGRGSDVLSLRRQRRGLLPPTGALSSSIFPQIQFGSGFAWKGRAPMEVLDGHLNEVNYVGGSSPSSFAKEVPREEKSGGVEQSRGPLP